MLHKHYQHGNQHGKQLLTYVEKGFQWAFFYKQKKTTRQLEAGSSKKLIFPTTLLCKADLNKFSSDRKIGIRKLFSSICILTNKKKKSKIAPTILCLLKILFQSIQKLQHIILGLHTDLWISKDLQTKVKVIVAKSHVSSCPSFTLALKTEQVFRALVFLKSKITMQFNYDSSMLNIHKLTQNLVIPQVLTERN